MGLASNRHQGLGTANAFHQAGNNFRIRVLYVEVQEIHKIEIDFVAGGDGIAETQSPGGRLFDPELQRAAALKHGTDRAFFETVNAPRWVER